MNKTDLINKLFERHPNLSHRDAKLIVNLVIESLSNAVAKDSGVEIRGFGSFQRKTRVAYIGKHPKTLKKTAISKRYLPFFKAGKILREEVKKMK